ncbi:MAG TPA: Ppx/GppA phosphatase family protein [Candidatus Humimicrobiaceae bacterium]|nr:Ppx/GppA phosphatase family protein [Candidatus Humimicrobiaceae bacterium]
MKLAAIDIGTNSTRLLITDYRNKEFFPLERKMEITRLGKSVDKNKTIQKDSARKTLEVLSGYWRMLKDYDVKKYRAAGTSAVRGASNRDWFVSYIFEHLGMTIDVLSGREEAKLDFNGAVRNVVSNHPVLKPETGAAILVLDVGGGSTEFILGDRNCSLELVKSLNLGSVSLTERFIGSGIPDNDDLNKMRRYITNKLEKTIEKIKTHKSLFIIGVAGTITTLAAIDLKLKVYDSEKIHNHVLDFERIEEIQQHLCRLNLEERKKVTGLDPARADIIIGGTEIVLMILKMLGWREILVSERDILDGIIYTLIDF